MNLLKDTRGAKKIGNTINQSGVSLAGSASPTTFLAGLKHTNFADKDCNSKAGCSAPKGGLSRRQMISIENNYLIEDGSLSDWSNKTEAVKNCELEETRTTRAGRAS